MLEQSCPNRGFGTFTSAGYIVMISLPRDIILMMRLSMISLIFIVSFACHIYDKIGLFNYDFADVRLDIATLFRVASLICRFNELSRGCRRNLLIRI